ncbi:MAG: hypothetical protein STHCBS139747_007011 [Sporothrix thermara]
MHAPTRTIRAHACDSCRRRKVRCNGQDPCSQCSRAGNACERRTALRRPGPRVAKRPADPSEHREAACKVAGELAGSPVLSQQSAENSTTPTLWPAPSPAVSAVSAASAFSTTSIVASDSLVWSEYLRIRAQLNIRFHAAVLSEAPATPETTGPPADIITDVAHGCVDLFLQYLFPNTPIAHEPTLRDSIPLLLEEGRDGTSPLLGRPVSRSMSGTISIARRFTLITALCAHILSVVPARLSRQPAAMSIVFFDASRAMLHAYEAYDLEHPDVTSLTIRMWHSSCAQNTTGKVGASWHYHTEACCLAMRLRLYEEATLVGVASRDPLEARLLRANFWHLYLAEKTQVAFRARPPIIDERLLDGGITLQEHGGMAVGVEEDEEGKEDDNDNDNANDAEIDAVPLLDLHQLHNQASLERRIFAGFHLRRRISASAAALIDDLTRCGQQRRRRQRDKAAGDGTQAPVMSPAEPFSLQDDPDPEVSALVERYLHFAALINSVPPWIMHPDRDANPLIPAPCSGSGSGSGTDTDTAAGKRGEERFSVQSYHTTCFWALNCNIVSIFHCMRLLILQACLDHGLPVVVGLGANTTALAAAARKLEIVRDFVHGLQAPPFVCLEAQGETAVDKVRRVGAILLKLLDESTNTTIRTQANALFQRLLDLLSRLDSKACEGL